MYVVQYMCGVIGWGNVGELVGGASKAGTDVRGRQLARCRLPGMHGSVLSLPSGTDHVPGNWSSSKVSW